LACHRAKVAHIAGLEKYIGLSIAYPFDAMAGLWSDPTFYLIILIFIIIIAILYIIRLYINRQNNIESEPELVSEDLTPNQIAFVEHRIEHERHSVCRSCGSAIDAGKSYCGVCRARFS
jgi:hypothetical protein